MYIVNQTPPEVSWEEDYKRLDSRPTFHISGSTVIVGFGADYDVILLDSTGTLVGQLVGLGYSACADKIYQGAEFTALRKGLVNAVVTTDQHQYEAWEFALAACLKIKERHPAILAQKEARVAVFSGLRQFYMETYGT